MLDADEIPEIEHAWLYDHLLPYDGDASGPAFEGWTLLTALAVQTRRLRFGLLVTNNRIRRPAVLAKVAATLDVISGGRLEFGIGIGGDPHAGAVAPEFDAYGIPHVSWRDAVASFEESLTLIRRLWTEDVVDVDGQFHRLRGARCRPRPAQRPHPPILIGGSGDATLRIVAGHADVWNAIGPPRHSVEQLVERSAALDARCVAIGRDPASIVRSVQLPITHDDPAATRAVLRRLVDGGFSHVVLESPAPFPPGVTRWIADELVVPTLERSPRPVAR